MLLLHDPGSPVALAEVHRDFLRFHPNGQFFFPVIAHGTTLDPQTNPLASYVFVVNNDEPAIRRLAQGCRFVSQLLRNTRGALALVSDEELLLLVRGLPRPYLRAGQHVLITAGDWSGLEAEVTQARGPQVHVRVTLCSRTRDLVVDRTEVKVI